MTYPKRIEEIFQIIGEKYANCESSLRVYFDEQEEKLTESVGLLRKIADWPNGGSQYGQENIKNAAKLFLARHVQAEQQESSEGSDYYCKVCRNHGCVSGCHPDYYKQQEAQGGGE